MRNPADPRPRPRPRRAVWRPAVAVALVLVTCGVLVVSSSPPAAAIHQHCGDDYPAGTLSTGHPDADSGSNGWTGLHVLQPLVSTLIAIDVTKATLDGTGGILVSSAESVHVSYDAMLQQGNPISVGIANAIIKPIETALRIAATAVYVAELAFDIAQTAIQATQLAIESDVNDENACGATLAADTVSLIWKAIVERNLASTGPPLAILMAPHDSKLSATDRDWPLTPQHTEGDFPWCPPVELPEELPSASNPAPAGPATMGSGDDCTSQVHIGFLDAPTLGVKDIVTDTIAHAVAHGLDVRGAEAILADADAALEGQRYADAFALYRSAYQTALRLTE